MNTKLTVSIFVLVAGLLIATSVHAEVAISEDGVTFPDNSVQTSATHTSYAIGDVGPGGGIVFYVTALGFHGLEAAPAPEPPASDPQTTWGCWGTVIAGADGETLGTGAKNTADILAGCAERPIAASVAAGYTWPEGQTDGFLPSNDELDLMYDNLHDQIPPLGGFVNGNYWTSLEFSNVNAIFRDFADGSTGGSSKNGNANRVRAVRAF